MVYRSARRRETKKLRLSAISTLEDKLRRHRNKKRIWLRALKRLTLEPVPIAIPYTTNPAEESAGFSLGVPTASVPKQDGYGEGHKVLLEDGIKFELPREAFSEPEVDAARASKGHGVFPLLEPM